MKLLFDHNLSPRLAVRLADLFPGSRSARDCLLATAADRAIWDYAATHGLAIVTSDSDFADLAVALGPPPRVIWLRCGNTRTAAVEALLRRHAAAVVALNDSASPCLALY